MELVLKNAYPQIVITSKFVSVIVITNDVCKLDYKYINKPWMFYSVGSLKTFGKITLHTCINTHSSSYTLCMMMNNTMDSLFTPEDFLLLLKEGESTLCRHP